MRKSFVYVAAALIALSGLAVLGNSPGLVGGFVESMNSGLISRVLFLNKKNDVEKSGVKTRNQPIDTETFAQTGGAPTEIPEYVLYDRMFSLVREFRRLADDQQSSGESITAFHGYIEREASLNEQEASVLYDLAGMYTDEVKLIDSKAEVVIVQLRNEHQARAASNQRLIPPSAELLKFQEQRNNLALQYRDRLADLLGGEKFAELNNFVKGEFASGFRVIPLSSELITTEQGGEK